MTKQALLSTFHKNHLELIDFVNALPIEKFNFCLEGKWSAGQQLNHVYLTLVPFTKVLQSKEYVLQKFGKISRPTWGIETVKENYFKTSLKAPPQFLPEPTSIDMKELIAIKIEEAVATIQYLLDQFSEDELDTLVLPHPLLGLLTIREMFYLMSYHPIHHLKQIEQGLRLM
jgi:uncharacterized damage-inducible protein DinB